MEARFQRRVEILNPTHLAKAGRDSQMSAHQWCVGDTIQRHGRWEVTHARPSTASAAPVLSGWEAATLRGMSGSGHDTQDLTEHDTRSSRRGRTGELQSNIAVAVVVVGTWRSPPWLQPVRLVAARAGLGAWIRDSPRALPPCPWTWEAASNGPSQFEGSKLLTAVQRQKALRECRWLHWMLNTSDRRLVEPVRCGESWIRHAWTSGQMRGQCTSSWI